MYTITVDDQIIYHPSFISDGYSVIDPKMRKETGTAGFMEFYIPTTNPMYDAVQPMKSILKVFEDGREVFRGRCSEVDVDFIKRKRVSCEGSLSFLNDSVVRPYSHDSIDSEQLFRNLITAHNEQTDPDKQFVIGNVEISKTVKDVSSDDYPDVLNEINDKLIMDLGGYLKIRYEDDQMYIDWIEQETDQCDQAIVFAQNIIDLSKFIKYDEIYTVLIPLGKNDDKYVTIKSVNNNKDYLENQSGIQVFGRIVKSIVYDDLSSASEVKTKGEEDLETGITGAMTISIQAVDLHLLNPDIDRIDEGELVQIISEPHGLNAFFPCRKVITYLAEPQKSEYEFGDIRKDLTNHQSRTDKKISRNIQTVNKLKTTVDAFPSKYADKTDLNNIYNLKGSVTNFTDLPSLGVSVGDLWNVTSDNKTYEYTDSGWVVSTKNLSNYTTSNSFASLEERVSRLEQG